MEMTIGGRMGETCCYHHMILCSRMMMVYAKTQIAVSVWMCPAQRSVNNVDQMVSSLNIAVIDCQLQC